MAIKDAKLDDLGDLVVGLIPDDAGRVLLYVEFDDGVLGPSPFYELDGDLRYVERPDPLFEELRRLQVLFGPEVRAMEFEIVGGNFSTHFSYADEFNADADILAREDAVLRKHFGHADVNTKSH